MPDTLLSTEPPPAADPPPEGTPPAADPPTLTPEEQKVADEKAAADKTAAEKTLTPEEQKVADEKAAAEKKEAEDKAKAEGAPEKYEDFKLPEGIEMDEAMLEKFVPLAKKHNLSQEAAQEFVDLRTEAVQEESQRQWDAWEKTQEEWAADSKSDKEIGGEKFEENLGLAKKAMDAYGNDALRDLEKTTGLGNNKDFLRFLVKIGNDLKEDKLNTGSPVTQEKSRANNIYNAE